jgi:hypothetical protein
VDETNIDPRIDTSVPHSARLWNYWLGGDQYRQVFPGVVDVARASRQFLTRSIEYIDADLREPAAVVAAARGVPGHVDDTGQARTILRELLEPLAPGSFLSPNDGTGVVSAEIREAQDDYNESGAMPYKLRSPDEIASFFDGLELVEPGVAPCPRWHPDDRVDTPLDIDAFGGVGRKPAPRS